MTTGTLPPPAPVEFGAVFSRAWEVFKRNWVVSLPPILAGVVIMAVVIGFIVVLVAAIGVAAFSAGGAHRGAASAGATGGAIGVAVVGSLVVTVLIVFATLWSHTAMYGMAEAALRRGSTTLGDGFAAFRARGGAMFVAWVAMFLLAIAALILALPTLFLSVIALGFATMYVFPSVVVGGRGGFDAVGESFRLIRRFFVPSIITWLVLYAIQYGISFLMMGAVMPLEFAAIPTGSEQTIRVPPIPLIMFGGIGYVVAFVLLLAYTGFLAMVQVAMYDELTSRPEALAP